MTTITDTMTRAERRAHAREYALIFGDLRLWEVVLDALESLPPDTTVDLVVHEISHAMCAYFTADSAAIPCVGEVGFRDYATAEGFHAQLDRRENNEEASAWNDARAWLRSSRAAGGTE
jgi:hypothetical protein